MHLGQMKAEMIRVNVLGPKTVRDILDDLSSTEGEPVYFSVAIDVSNKGNKKKNVSSVREIFLCLMECTASNWTFMKTVMKRLMAYIKH